MKKIPSIDMEAIEDVVSRYTKGSLRNAYDSKASINGTLVSTPEEYLAEYTKFDRALSHEEVVMTLTSLLESGILNNDSKKLCELLINNPRYTHKLKLVFDGSYRINRIWFNHEHELSLMCIDSCNRPYYQDFKGKSVKYKLNWMWNHYDEIYFQVPLFRSAGEVFDDMFD